MWLKLQTTGTCQFCSTSWTKRGTFLFAGAACSPVPALKTQRRAGCSNTLEIVQICRTRRWRECVLLFCSKKKKNFQKCNAICPVVDRWYPATQAQNNSWVGVSYRPVHGFGLTGVAFPLILLCKQRPYLILWHTRLLKGAVGKIEEAVKCVHKIHRSKKQSSTEY